MSKNGGLSPNLAGEFVEASQHNRQATSASLKFWAKSIGDRNPRFVRDSYQSKFRTSGFVAHPCWLYSVNSTIVSSSEPGICNIVAGTTWSFVRDVVVSDKLFTKVRVISETEKTSRHAGRARVQLVEVCFFDAIGQLVARAVTTLFGVSPQAARQSEKFSTWRRWRYSEEELLAIEADYDKETVRGDQPRYWDHVNVGDELPYIVRGPVSSEEIVLFVGATCPSLGGSGFTAERLAGRAESFIHPRTGTYETYAAGLIDDESAQQLGFPAAHDLGIDRISQAGSLITNWAGDMGFLRSLTTKLLVPNMLGDTTWYHGKVIEKHSMSSEVGTVSVDLYGMNQRQCQTIVGRAIVELPIKYNQTA